MQGGLESGQLDFRESVKKRLKEDDRFAEAGIQIVVDGVQRLPIPIRERGVAGD